MVSTTVQGDVPDSMARYGADNDDDCDNDDDNDDNRCWRFLR